MVEGEGDEGNEEQEEEAWKKKRGDLLVGILDVLDVNIAGRTCRGSCACATLAVSPGWRSSLRGSD